MSFKGFKPGVHILILQIIITAILGFYFQLNDSGRTQDCQQRGLE